MISKNTVLKTNLDCAATPRGVAALPTGASVLSMKRVENRSLLVFRIPLCVGIDFSGALESASTIENGNPMIMAFASLVNATVSSKSESVSVHCMEVPRRAGPGAPVLWRGGLAPRSRCVERAERRGGCGRDE